MFCECDHLVRPIAREIKMGCRLILWIEAKMDTEKGLLNGEFLLKTLTNGSFDNTKIICRYS